MPASQKQHYHQGMYTNAVKLTICYELFDTYFMAIAIKYDLSLSHTLKIGSLSQLEFEEVRLAL